MGPLDAPKDQLEALDDERAFVDLSAFRKVRVSGVDARGWLGDLVTCDVASLEPGRSRRGLLLTPTGRIRADFWVALDEEGFLLLQAPDQPDSIGSLLAPYVLSSDVLVQGSTSELSLFAAPGHAADAVGRAVLAPSVVGAGVDLTVPTGEASRRVEEVFAARGLIEAGSEAAEVLRIRRGIARMGVDFEQDALPAEVGLEFAIDTTKGCFLGQESVARIRNLGRVSHVLRAVRSMDQVTAGDHVRSGGERVGEVTSAAVAESDGTAALIRVRSAAGYDGLVTSQGAELVAVGSMD